VRTARVWLRWPVTAALVLAAASAPACATPARVEEGLTGLMVTVVWDPALGIDQLVFSGTLAGDDASVFASTPRPDPPAPLDSGNESLVILLPDALADQMIALRVDALSGGTLVAAGIGSTTPVVATIVQVVVTLAEPAICGDGTCTDAENQCTCMEDCPRVCGDGCCDVGHEDPNNCPADC